MEQPVFGVHSGSLTFFQAQTCFARANAGGRRDRWKKSPTDPGAIVQSTLTFSIPGLAGLRNSEQADP
jgi:hypothetical protein